MTDKGLHNVRQAELAVYFKDTTLTAKLVITFQDQTTARQVFEDVPGAVRDCQDWIDDAAQKNPDMTAQQAVTTGLYKFWRDQAERTEREAENARLVAKADREPLGASRAWDQSP